MEIKVRERERKGEKDITQRITVRAISNNVQSLDVHISGVLACCDETCGREERIYDGKRKHTLAGNPGRDLHGTISRLIYPPESEKVEKGRRVRRIYFFGVLRSEPRIVEK